jgi:hypothetical protein
MRSSRRPSRRADNDPQQLGVMQAVSLLSIHQRGAQNRPGSKTPVGHHSERRLRGNQTSRRKAVGLAPLNTSPKIVTSYPDKASRGCVPKRRQRDRRQRFWRVRLG